MKRVGGVCLAVDSSLNPINLEIKMSTVFGVYIPTENS